MSRIKDQDLKNYQACLHVYPYRRLSWLERHESSVIHVLTWVVFAFVLWKLL